MKLFTFQNIAAAAAFGFAGSVVQAGDQLAAVSHSAPLPRAEAVASPAEEPKFESKTKSTFTLPLETRAPFWPIGWVKGPNRPVTVKGPKIMLDERAFSVTSILLGEQALAVVNGRAYSEGEFLRLPKAGGGVRVRVQRINDGSVTLQHDDQMIVVPLRRPELSDRKPEADVLNEDR